MGDLTTNQNVTNSTNDIYKQSYIHYANISDQDKKEIDLETLNREIKDRYYDGNIFLKKSDNDPFKHGGIEILGNENIPWIADGVKLFYPYNKLILPEEHEIFLDNVYKWRQSGVDTLKAFRENKESYDMIGKELTYRNDQLGNRKLSLRAIQSLHKQIWVYYPNIFAKVDFDQVNTQREFNTTLSQIKMQHKLQLTKEQNEVTVKKKQLEVEKYLKVIANEMETKAANELSSLYQFVKHDLFETVTKIIEPDSDFKEIVAFENKASSLMRCYSTCEQHIKCWIIKNSNYLIDVDHYANLIHQDIIKEAFNLKDQPWETIERTLKGIFIITKEVIPGHIPCNNDYDRSIKNHYLQNSQFVYGGNPDIAEKLRVIFGNTVCKKENREIYFVTFIPQEKFINTPYYIGNLGLVVGCGVVKPNTAHIHSKPAYISRRKNGFNINYNINTHVENKVFWIVVNDKPVKIVPEYNKYKNEHCTVTYYYNNTVKEEKSCHPDNTKELEELGIYDDVRLANEYINGRIKDYETKQKIVDLKFNAVGANVAIANAKKDIVKDTQSHNQIMKKHEMKEQKRKNKEEKQKRKGDKKKRKDELYRQGAEDALKMQQIQSDIRESYNTVRVSDNKVTESQWKIGASVVGGIVAGITATVTILKLLKSK